MKMMKRSITMETKIVVETHPNNECRTYHTDFEISKDHIENFWRPVRPESKEYLQKLGRKGGTLVRRLLALSGIAEVTIQPYEIMVQKGQAFSWENLELQILETIENLRPKGKKSQEVSQSAEA